MKKILILCLLLLLSVPSYGALTAKAKSYLDQIPEKKVTLPFVIKTALENAEAYKILGYQAATAQLEEMGTVDPLTETYLNASADYADDNSSKTSAFQPLRSKQWKYSLGLTKDWSTGTKTFIGWDYDTLGSEFSNTGGFSNVFITNYKQSAAVLRLEQNLLKNSFGYSFRRKRQAARRRGESIQWKTREDLENLTIQFVEQFYGAWLTKQQVASIENQVLRQKRLVKVLTRRSQQGAVEKPDLIQIESLLASNRTRLSIAESTLKKQWETLVVSLKLPTEFLQINPMDIPIAIDHPVPLGLRVCGLKEPKKTASIASLEKTLAGLDADFKASKNDTLPDLKLIAGYRGNSIDPSASDSVQGVLSGRDEDGFGRGPAWNVGLQMIWPLNNSQARAVRTQKYIEKEQVSARLRASVDDLTIEWRDLCRRLRVESDNEKIFRNVVDQQKKRVQAEDKRFSLGRASVNQLVVSEDDLGDWEYRSQAKEVEVRLLAWRVQKYSGELYRQIDPIIGQLLEGEQK